MNPILAPHHGLQNQQTLCRKCLAPLSESRLKAVKLEREILGSSDTVCSECFNKQVAVATLV